MRLGNLLDNKVHKKQDCSESILFLCYDNPFNKSAHSICLLTMIQRLLDHDGLQGCTLHLLALNCVSTERTLYAHRQEQFIQKYRHRIHVSLYSRTFPKRHLYATLYELIRSQKRVRSYIAQHAITTAYVYGDVALLLLYQRALTQTSLKIIFDCRGDHIAEEQARGVRWPLLWGYRYMFRKLLPLVGTSFVSSSRIVQLLKGYGNRGRFVLNSNYFDDTVYKREKRPFNYQSPLFVYAGGGQPYQQLEKMLRVFKAYQNNTPRARLMLVLSVIDEHINALIKRIGIDQSHIQVHSAATAQQVNGYLNKCDIAFMLRDHQPLNYYAFPTKFSEYLGAGLPLITTTHVYDTAEIIRKEALGVLIDIESSPEEIAVTIHNFITHVPRTIASNCAQYAQEHLSWRRNVGRISAEILAS